MRVIPAAPKGPGRPTAADPADGPEALRFVRGAIRNAPWLAIAVVAHVVVIAILSVVYMTQPRRETAESVGRAVVAVEEAFPEEEPALAPEPEIRRDLVPAARTPEEAGPTNPDDVVIEGEAAGRPGEIVPGGSWDKEPGVDNPYPSDPTAPTSGEPSGTSIGVGSKGRYGLGKPSAWLTERAGLGRPGGGGTGQNGRRGPGGVYVPPGERDSVLTALQWLRNHQSPDGRWDCDGFDVQCKLNRCDGPGDGTNDPGVTGLAVLAFLGAGQTHQSGVHRETVKRGVRWLKDAQDAEGCVGPRTSHSFMYNHACGALALVEAYGMTQTPSLRAPAVNALAFVQKARNPYLAWRYSFPPDGDNDTSVTGWMVMVLKSAHLAGLDYEGQAMKDSIAWVDKMTEPEFGRTGYQQRGGAAARTEAMAARFPASKSESLTAVGLTVRLFGGRDPAKDEMVAKGADLLLRQPPRWDVDAGTIDYYYWYYGSLAMFQVGGERWKKWNASMKTALLDHQRREKDRDEHGSWDPADCWSDAGGRVYATALNGLTREVSYRYPQAFGLKGGDAKSPK